MMYLEEHLLVAKKLSFPPEMEAEFIAAQNIGTVKALHRFAWATSALLLISGFLDGIFFAHYRWEFAVIRMAMAVIAFVAMRVCLVRQSSRQGKVERRVHLVWGVVFVAGAFNIFQCFIRPEDTAYSSYGLTNAVFIALGFTLSRASLVQASVGAMCMIGFYNLYAIPSQLLPHPDEYRLIFVGTNIRLLFIAVIMAVVGFLLESARRQDFIKTALLEQERQRVQQQNSEILHQQEVLESSAREAELANAHLVNLNNELRVVNADLHQANTFKVQMLSVVSHDLKNPIVGILGLAEALQDDLHSMSAEQQRQFLAQIQSSSVRMLNFIQELLDSASLELGTVKLRKAPFQADSLWNTVQQELLKTLHDKQQHIVASIEQGIVVIADADRVYQVFYNLLSNASKYSPRGAQILVSLSRFGANLRFVIQDQGPGFTDEDKPKLFGMFQRLSAQPTGGESSHGVGLAIVRLIVEAHGGTIRLEDTPLSQHTAAGQMRGATFIVEIPLHGSGTELAEDELAE